MTTVTLHPAYSTLTDAELVRYGEAVGDTLTAELARRLDRRLGKRDINPTVFHDQAAFMQACGQSTTEVNDEQAEMYARLINEELQELDDAATAGDDVEEFDAVLDLIVVVIGYGLSRGFPMVQGWDEVMRSNMSKVGPDGKVIRRDDGKILKPDTYSPPDLNNVLGLYAPGV